MRQITQSINSVVPINNYEANEYNISQGYCCSACFELCEKIHMEKSASENMFVLVT